MSQTYHAHHSLHVNQRLKPETRLPAHVTLPRTPEQFTVFPPAPLHTRGPYALICFHLCVAIFVVLGGVKLLLTLVLNNSTIVQGSTSLIETSSTVNLIFLVNQAWRHARDLSATSCIVGLAPLYYCVDRAS